MLTFSEYQPTEAKTYMRFSKVFQAQQESLITRDKRVQAVQPAQTLLNTPERMALIQEIQELSGANAKDYQTLYADLIHRFVEFVQLLPSYEHPAYTWLDHHLRLAKTALKMREQYLLIGESLHPIISKQDALWHYVVFSSALLQKIGLLFTHYQVSLCNEQGQHIATWMPMAGNMGDQGNYYKLQELFTQDIPYIESIHLLLARQLMPIEGFNWIASDKDALMAWLGIVEGERSGGVSHQLVILSEKQIYENTKAQALLEELFHTESLEALLKAHGLTEQELLALLPLLHGLEKNDTELSLQFYEWLNREITAGNISVNQPQSLVQTTDNKHYLIAPEVLALFAQRQHQAAHAHWFDLFKNAQVFGLNALTASDIHLSRFLVASNITHAAHERSTSEIFHQTLQDKTFGENNATSVVQGAKLHEQNRVQTVAALNKRGFMLGGLYGSTKFKTHTEYLAHLQEQQDIKHQTALETETTQQKAQIDAERFEHVQKLIIQRREELRHALEKQYAERYAAENKSNFSYSFSSKK